MDVIFEYDFDIGLLLNAHITDDIECNFDLVDIGVVMIQNINQNFQTALSIKPFHILYIILTNNKAQNPQHLPNNPSLIQTMNKINMHTLHKKFLD
jgi:hypothetical protein